ncbi:ATPase [Candidatus Gottesmanbacteria bacterium CG11_big_fil_rev_8_21_14_0_20_37_11]|uniref:ATPase n=2 Tax=Candidatus Gottesmaniibacteriota TaxID=1752720 RepID=A0A2M7RQ86_9BACT|nr:MAG: ATPase [Candidatus Gottesmanbacteria bacterium CG23_combo_of_CG06-09_8_20_14_all_37_19]PIR08976.1 MAG: ATPase [Candidatus Gottesmanbacteria bacterium CG11_big_fil_rev_8_21_14_0_20_37_11]PIZ02491.1 MAG: ATPase [Candidatus Gottesmanbacteria bacterium CG_4_10_14_0_8_um_filter_37_24]
MKENYQDIISGLSQKEASERLRTDGVNELPSQKKQNIITIFLRVVSEPMLLLLIGSGLIYLFLGEVKDALMLLSFIFVVIGITFYQERKTERTLEALRNLSSPRALIIRDGERKRIPGREVVKGDIIILQEGDRVPADTKVLSCENLSVDESLLTGESIAVRKSSWNGKTTDQRPGGDDLPFVYSGSLIVSGRGMAQVIYTGAYTQMGKIGKALETIKEEDTLLKKETAKIVKAVSIIGLSLCILIVLIYGLIKGNLLQGFLSGLALSMAILPEEFPVVLLIFLTLGAWRISKRKVLTRRSAVIETLGAATVLCVDKTGTLTLNQMKLTCLFSKNSYYELSDLASTLLPEKHHNLLEYGILASQRDPFDPVEKEIKKMGELYLKNTEHIHINWNLVKEYPLSKELLALSHVWQSPDKKDFVIAAKGAPEAILDLCHAEKSIRKKTLDSVKEMSERGLRVLGVAKASFSKSGLPKKQHDYDFEFIGLFGFIDPIRSTVPDAVKEAHNAGIRVAMITGDYPGTAIYIARKIGLVNPDNYLSGSELSKLNHMELREKIKNVNIFARVVPEQKLLIVNAFKANGEIVAMTGDGVNDAPALKSANIGISMGERGTDVAREASSLVLLNDDFSSIIAAIRLGRRIYDNLKRAMGYIFAVHIPIAGMSLLPVIFNLPPVLLPAHIAFLELIIDPACSTVFESEKEEDHIMKKPPRSLYKPMFDRKTITISILQGLSILISVFLIYIYYLYVNKNEMGARSITFTTLVMANLMLIATNLSWKKNIFQIISSANKALLIVSVFAILALLVVIYIPFFVNLFHFTYLNPVELLLSFIAACISILWFEAVKFTGKIIRK